MTERKQLGTLQFLLPFSVRSENRIEPFTEDMEKATIFYIAELDRAKEGGLILKHPAEKLAFLAEVSYPFWLVPWNGLNLLFDGLGAVTHDLTYKAIPNVKVFMEKVERSSKTFEVYLTFLSDNIDYFQASTTEKRVVMKGLVTDSAFLAEFASYLSEAKQVEAESSNLAILSPMIDESALSSVMDELEDLKSQFSEDASLLHKSMKLLNKTTRDFLRTIRGKMKTVREQFAEEIKKQESIIQPQVDRVNEEYGEQITKLTKDFETQLLPLQKEKLKLERSREQTRDKIEHYKMEAKTSKASKDVTSEKNWKEKVDISKTELSEIEAKIGEAEETTKSMQENRSFETFRLNSELEAKVKEAEKDLRELEASREAQVQFHEQEIEKLEKLTSKMIEQIDGMTKLRESNLSALLHLGIEQKHAENAIVGIPFYLVCYQSDSKRRYVIIPPSVVNSVGFSTRLKGALGKAKVKQLLIPRFERVTSFLYRFPMLVEENAVLESEITEASGKADLLKTFVKSGHLGNGLKQLREEGWLSQKEYEAFVGIFP